MEKVKYRYNNGGGKEKASEYSIKNKEDLKETSKNKCRNLPEEEKEAKREYGRNRYRNMTEDKDKLREY